ncbi:YaiI/YqxD family protein [Marinobacterium sedimentorum]|uniref:YaiI/YqxD family protein n=1 Tax=Marinobacterium sedimentorum TaxID=2927804 RepID=UPI0020C631B3|nr:YaiI/YqxD family protein [Marinobacterium sedimentorum]MCP8687412.1 YaiI/YqxD family protein [Marinobacterium sedimentorum]
MHIWVDADACPKMIKDILFRAAQRTNTRMTLVANQFMSTPPGNLIDAIQVASGFDVADNTIVSKLQPGDLVITADIPLAADVIDNNAWALNPRGELYTRENIRQRLSMRDFMETLRSSGIQTGGPAALGNADRQAFANQLDRFLARASAAGQNPPRS